MSSSYFVILYGGRVMGFLEQGPKARTRAEEMAGFFGDGSEVLEVHGAFPSDIAAAAKQYYAAQEQEVREEVEELLALTEEERLELLEVIESPDVRAMFERPDLSDWPEDCDTTHVTSRSGLFKASKLGIA